MNKTLALLLFSPIFSLFIFCMEDPPDLSAPDLSAPDLSAPIYDFEELRSKTPALTEILPFSDESIITNKVIHIEFEECKNIVAYDVMPFMLERVLFFLGYDLSSKDKVSSQLYIFDGYYTVIRLNDISLSLRFWLPTRSLGGKASIRIRYPKNIVIDTLPILEYLKQQLRPVSFTCTD